MEKNINFLRDRIALWKKKARRLFLTRTLSVGLLVIYGILVLGVFSYNLILKKQSQILKEKMQREEKVIESLRPIETKQIYLASKVESLSGVLTSKRKHQEIVDSLFFVLPEGISVSNFQISEDGTVSFSGTCSELRVLKIFLDILEAEDGISEVVVKKAHIGNINYGFEKEYHFNISLLFYLGKSFD